MEKLGKNKGKVRKKLSKIVDLTHHCSSIVSPRFQGDMVVNEMQMRCT